MIYIANKKRKIESIQKDYPNAVILDITSLSPYRYGQLLSPFYPHGNIPIPGDSRGMTATCVEAIWQGLKVFEHEGIDTAMFRNDTMKNIKRTVRKFGRPLGHQYGVYSKTLLDYASAKRLIYAPSYKYVLDNVPEVHSIIERIKAQSEKEDIVLLDYNLNPDNRDASKPLSHAEFVKMYIEGRYPVTEEDFKPRSVEELIQDKIFDLLNKTSMTAADIKKSLSLKWSVKTIKSYLEGIPDIRIEKIKRSEYYTLTKPQINPTLFD